MRVRVRVLWRVPSSEQVCRLCDLLCYRFISIWQSDTKQGQLD